MHSVSWAALLAVLIATAGLLTAPFERRFFKSDLSTGSKLWVYGALMLMLWTLAGAALFIYGWTALRTSPPNGSLWLTRHKIADVALATLVAAYFIVAVQPLVQSMRGTRWRLAYAAAVRRHGAAFPGLLPNNMVECLGFALLSLTAGYCEEVLFRGYLTQFLAPNVPLIAVVILSSLLFGMNHAYQGVRGILNTVIAGFAFALLFVLTSDLLPGIILHALIDLQTAYVLRPIEETPVEIVAASSAT